MIAWLYNHVSPFRKSVNKLLFKQQALEANLEFDFMGPDGSRYYRYTDDLQLPMVRKGMLETLMTRLTINLTQKELGEYFAIIRACHQELLTAGELKSKPFSIIGYLITEMEERKNLPPHPEVLYELWAVIYIREGEKLTSTYDLTLHKKKAEWFKEWTELGIFDFFLLRGWQGYLPYSNTSPQGLKNSVASIRPTLEAQRKMRSSLMELLGLSSNASGS